mgnify:CR=1 FL=1
MNLKRSLYRARKLIGRKLAGDPVKGYYEAARPSPYHKRRGVSETADSATRGAIESLRAEARYLEQNYDLVSGGLDVFVNAIIGRGLIPRALVRSLDGKLHKESNVQIAALFKDWMLKPEVTGEHTYQEVQRLTARAWARDGEMFSQRLIGFVPSLDHLTQVPFSIEMIEPDLFPVGFTDEKRRIVSSVQKNEWGRATNYWCHRSYIGEAMAAVARAGAVEPDKRIPATRVTHLKHVTRFRQTRGVSVLAPTLDRFDSIKDGEESENVAMRVAAAMTGYVQRGSPDMYTVPEKRQPRELSMNPGQIYELEEGESIGTIQSNRPNNHMVEYMKDQHRRAAAGMKVAFSSLSNNYEGSYSAMRQERTDKQIGYGACSRYFADHMITPDYRAFIEAAIASGAWVPPADVDLSTVLHHDIPLPAMPWIDPSKEASAWTTLVDARLESRQHVMSERGRDPETVWGEIKDEEEHHPARVQDQPDPNSQTPDDAQNNR